MENDPHEVLRNPAVREESRRIRRLQFLVRFALLTIAEGHLSYEEASALVARIRKTALNLFPGKDTAFDVLCQPHLRRALVWRYRLQ